MEIFKGNYRVTADKYWHLRNEKGYALDFGTPVGTQLVAVLNGIVEKHNTWWGGEDTIILIGDNGVCYLYAHCSKTVKTGRVSQGEVIALSGNEGNSTGEHLHFAADRNKQQLLKWSVSWSDTELENILKAKPQPKGGKNVRLIRENKYDIKITADNVPLFHDSDCTLKGSVCNKNWEYQITKLNNNNYIAVGNDKKLWFLKNHDVDRNTKLK